MKHSRYLVERQIVALKKLFEKFSIPYDETLLSQFREYISLIIDWSDRVSLVSSGDGGYLVDRHIFEGVLAARKALIPFWGRLLDIGSGAGFPVVPIKLIRPDIRCFALDSNRKKVLFLKKVAQTLGLLGFEPLWTRFELVSFPFRFDAITVRAVGNNEAILRRAGELLLPTGKLLFFKADKTKTPLIERGGVEIPLGDISASATKRVIVVFGIREAGSG